MKKIANIFFYNNINAIGGVETYLYEIAKKYGDYDIVIAYKNCDEEQLKRLKKYVKTIKVNPNIKIQCKRLFLMFNHNVPYFEADETYLILHAWYEKAYVTDPNLKIKKIYGCSKSVADRYTELFKAPTETCYNPITYDKPRKVLKLISPTRLTPEKGKERIKRFAELLDKNNIPYIWLIFTDDIGTIDNPNIAYMKPKLDIRDYIASADYLVNLSSTEGYSYGVLESLCLGTPVIVTPVPCYKEMRVENGVNGYIVDFNLKDVPIKEIYEHIPKFEYTPNEDRYDELIIKEKSTYKEELKMKYRVRALDTFTIPDLERSTLKENGEYDYYFPKVGEEWIVSKERLDVLMGDNKYNTCYVENLGTVEEPKKEIKKVEEKPIKKEVKKTTKKK